MKLLTIAVFSLLLTALSALPAGAIEAEVSVESVAVTPVAVVEEATEIKTETDPSGGLLRDEIVALGQKVYNSALVLFTTKHVDTVIEALRQILATRKNVNFSDPTALDRFIALNQIDKDAFFRDVTNANNPLASSQVHLFKSWDAYQRRSYMIARHEYDAAALDWQNFLGAAAVVNNQIDSWQPLPNPEPQKAQGQSDEPKKAEVKNETKTETKVEIKVEPIKPIEVAPVEVKIGEVKIAPIATEIKEVVGAIIKDSIKLATPSPAVRSEVKTEVKAVAPAKSAQTEIKAKSETKQDVAVKTDQRVKPAKKRGWFASILRLFVKAKAESSVIVK
ncbi:MAG TPA: hypothetical protein VJB92_02240 [Candidatus Paceibacterota bacterium]